MDERVGRQRNTALDAMRGVAALTVVFGHCAAAFAYVLPIVWPPQIVALLFNGSASVEFFFVLSGYVLTRSFVLNEDWLSLARAVAKRYFRLLGPVLLATLISLALFKTGAYRYEALSKPVQSSWLYCFGSAYPPDVGWVPSLSDALWRGGVAVFFMPGNQHYDSPLGTISYETLGSFMVFALAAVAVLARKVSATAARVLLVAAFVAIAGQGTYAAPYYAAFVVGLALSLELPATRKQVPPYIAAALFVLGLVFMSYQGARGEYAFIARLGLGELDSHWFNLVGATLLIVAVEVGPGIRAHLEGRVGAFLGRLSFPIYIMHFLVIGSLGSAVWLWAQPRIGDWPTAALASAVTVIVSVLVSLPVIAFDQWWVAGVNRAASRILRRPAVPALQHRN